MAVDYFLKIDGIEGESKDSKHQNEIEIGSFSFGATQTGSFSAMG
ncbi:MAG: type VI secretion system tube protein Hcp, partial [Verrucomicrobia bacterium]|nr:type VI secretion system tube protein Hcp [Verrucomicrobiota bacterium]